VLACTPGKAPSRGAAAWFTRPKQRGVDPVAAHLSRLFCAAAPHSTIDISMYFIRAFGSQPDVRPILTSLRRAVRYHRVRVRILLEGRLYGRGKPLRSGLGPLRRFAKVILCHDGCHNERSAGAPGHGIMHHKFVTIGDMSWSRGADPVVVESSANWSQTQLENAWQSAVLVYDDHELYRELHIQFETLATCASGCAGWTRRMAQLGLPASTYGLSDVRRLWRDAAPAERKAAPGSGRGMVFSPWPRRDPLAVALNGYTCTSAHHTVLVDHMFVTAGRQPVIDALAGLARRGCRVRVILQKLTHSPLADGARRIRAAGLPVSCVARLHDKVVMVNAVRSSDGRADKAVWTGSQSLGGRALRFNDEALLRVSTADAAGAARVANAALYSRFLSSWKALTRHRQRC
jgi:phosphatidylserine/phosphatidylglycerophosphate/cardiolipin synthase-like enzyme